MSVLLSDDNHTPTFQELQSEKSVRLKDLESIMRVLDQILSQPNVTDLMINSWDHIYYEQQGRMVRAPFTIANNELVGKLAEKLAHLSGKAYILENSFVLDGMLPNNHRLTIIMPPVAIGSPSISIRSFPKDVFTLDKMVEVGLLTKQMGVFLKTAVRERANILVAGNTSSGKTTLLNALTEHILSTDRLVTIEDTPELQVQQDNVVRLEIDPASRHDAHNAATPRALLKSSLRIRPDRIIIGEIRGAEAFDFIQAINTGHRGSMATMHANSPRETLIRLEHMVSMGVEMPGRLIKQQISSSLDLVIQTYRSHDGTRRISHITEVVGMEGDVMITHDHFTFKNAGNEQVVYQWNRSNSRNPIIQLAIKAASEVK